MFKKFYFFDEKTEYFAVFTEIHAVVVRILVLEYRQGREIF